MADDTQDLLRLADQVMAATGPDRELDLIIWFAVTGRPFLGFVREINPHGLPETYNWYGKTTGNRSVSIECAPEYTGSLDAGMTLVPPEHDLQFTSGWSEPTEAVVAHHLVARNDHIATAATPALALCAAALKARAHSTKDQDNVG